MAGPLLLLGLLWFSSLCSAGCSEQVELHIERRGVIYSPLWPLNYPAGVNCSWHIQAEKGEVITISFWNFDLAESDGCRGDWLVLTPTWKLESRLCGSVLPPPFISTTHHVWLYFSSQSSSSGQAQGFRLSYIRGQLGQNFCMTGEFLCDNGKCLPQSWWCNGFDECGDATDEKSCSPPPTDDQPGFCPFGYLTCTEERSTRCLPSSLLCNGVADCLDGSDELGCTNTTCHHHLGNFYGSFASQEVSWPARSAVAELRCSWLLDTQDPRPIVLQMELWLGPDDSVHVYNSLEHRDDHLIQAFWVFDNHRPVMVESDSGQMSLLYRAQPHSSHHGFNATYQVQGYCFPNELPCGDHRGCFSEHQRCDGYWHCPSGRDEEACGTCPAGEFPCNKPPSVCYPASERCNNQRRCPDGADETNCYECQPGNFHCGKRCIFEMWQCDGHEDCFDGSDEKDCLEATPREVIAAALIGSLACSLMLVIALGCAIKLCSLGGGDYSSYETQMSRREAELIRREAPPSYGQLIAQGLIPNLDDYPAYNQTQASVLQNLRQAMRRQLRRHSSRRSNPCFSRRPAPLWTRSFPGGRMTAGRDLDPPGSARATRGLRGYQTLGAEGHPFSPGSGGGVGDGGALPECFAMVDLRPCSPERSASPPPSQPQVDVPPVGRVSRRAWTRLASRSEPPVGVQSHSSVRRGPPPTVRELYPLIRRNRTSRKLVLELAANLRGMSLIGYSSLGPVSPLSHLSSLSSLIPQPQTSTSQGQGATSSPEPSSAIKDEVNNHQVSVQVPPGDMRSQEEEEEEEERTERKSRANRSRNDEEGDMGTETTPC